MRILSSSMAALAVALFTTPGFGDEPVGRCHVATVVCESLPKSGCFAPALNGRLAAIDNTLEASIRHLDAGDLQRFTDAAHALVSAFDGASADIQNACREAGYTLARLEHASLLLSKCSDRDALLQGDLSPAAQDVADLRDRLVRQLSEDHLRFKSETNSEKKRRLLNSMEATVQRVEQLTTIVRSSREADGFQLPIAELRQLLEEATATVRAEQEMLMTQSRALSAIVVQAFGCMETSLQMRSVSMEFPDEQIVKLKETRQSLTSLILLSQQAHGASRALAQDSVSRVPTDSLTDGVLSRVQQVLSAYPAPAGAGQ